MTAYCGLNCQTCDAYSATQENDDTKRKETAKKWSKMYNVQIEPGQINCTGCSGDGTKFFHCSACDIRKCCISHQVENCAECKEYICDTLTRFIALAPQAGAALEKIRAST